MSTTPYMPVPIDSAFADITSNNLTAEQFGAYMRLLMVIWRGCVKPIKDDNATLAKCCGVACKRWVEKIRPSLEPLFLVENGSWRHLRTEEQWAFVQRNREKQSEKGKKSAAAKALKNNETTSTVVDPRRNQETEPKKEEDPVAIATGSEPATVVSFPIKEDPVSRLWREGVNWLSEKSSRPVPGLKSQLGQWLRDYGDGPVLIAFRETYSEDPVDPVSRIIFKLKKGNTNHGRNYSAGKQQGSAVWQAATRFHASSRGPELDLDTNFG